MQSNPNRHKEQLCPKQAGASAPCTKPQCTQIFYMVKKRLNVRIKSFGIYDSWTGDQKKVPTIKQFTTNIPACIGIEFGYVLQIKHGRGAELDFEIDHPPWLGDDGSIEPPFRGSFFVRHNDYDFFLGDTIWEPWENKLGPWRLRTWHDGALLADKTLDLIDPDLL